MAEYRRFAPRAVEETFNKFFISRQMWEEQGFAYSDAPNYGIDDFLFDKIAYQEWQVFCLQPPRANSTMVREFYAHGPSKDSLYVHYRGRPVKIDAEAINQFYGLHPVTDAHAEFVEEITDEDYELIKDDLCYEGTRWETGSHKGSVPRLSLKPEAKLWNTFVKRRLMPTSHSSTVDRTRLALIQSIMNKRSINVGAIILEEIYECAQKDKGPLSFPCLITGLCTAVGAPTDEDDEYTKVRRGWTRDYCYKLMHITDADPVQGTPMPGTAGASQAAEEQPSPQHTAAADPYQQILQRLEAMDLRQHSYMHKLEAMDLRQQRYMEYQRDYNAAMTQMMMRNFPHQDVQFPEFPANIFVTAAPYTETTPAPAGFHPYTAGPFQAAGPSRPAASAAASTDSRRPSKRRATTATPPRSPIIIGSFSEEVESYRRRFPPQAGPSTFHAAVDPMDLEEGGTEVLPTEEVDEEEEEGEEVTAPLQRTPPSRIQPPREAKAQQTPQSKGKKLKFTASRSKKFTIHSSESEQL